MQEYRTDRSNAGLQHPRQTKLDASAEKSPIPLAKALMKVRSKTILIAVDRTMAYSGVLLSPIKRKAMS